MSDHISKEQAIDVLKETGIIQDNDLGHLVVEEINRIPIISETEIIRKSFERVVERLEEIQIGRTEEGVVVGCNLEVCEDDDCIICLKKKIINIIKEEGGIE